MKYGQNAAVAVMALAQNARRAAMPLGLFCPQNGLEN